MWVEGESFTFKTILTSESNGLPELGQHIHGAAGSISLPSYPYANGFQILFPCSKFSEATPAYNEYIDASQGTSKILAISGHRSALYIVTINRICRNQQ